MKSDVFNKEISYIKDERLKKNLIILLNMLPDYFYHIATSSTGKYHPECSLGEGGLVRHVKVASRMAIEFFENNSLQNYTNKEKDLLLISILLHDGLKCGLQQEKYTRFDHPILMANFIRENKDKLTLDDYEIDFIVKCIETHMGEWTTDYNGNEVLRKPSTKYERFVHMCDYLSSRRYLNIKFINNEIE